MGLLVPSNGKILIDDNDLESINKEYFRKNLGFVPQENMFFNETLRENLAFNNHLSETSMYEALEKAQLSKFVKSLPNKLDTIIGEGGVKLSGGQKQDYQYQAY